jgi:hypothetical protein
MYIMDTAMTMVSVATSGAAFGLRAITRTAAVLGQMPRRAGDEAVLERCRCTGGGRDRDGA